MTDAAPGRPAPLPEPRIGIGVLVVSDGRVLLGQRLGSHGAGTWAAPGGHLEFGESFEACAHREVLEETNLQIDRLQLGPTTNDVFADEGRHYVTCLVLARVAGGELRTMEPHKCAGWQWFAWDALPEPLFAPLARLRDSGYRLPTTLAGASADATLLAWLSRLETELHHPGSACTPERLDELLHPEFHEVGRSGRAYDRATVVSYLSQHPGPAAAEAGGHALQRMGEDAALLHFWTSHPAGPGEPWVKVLRVSLWRLTAVGWQLAYHHATPAALD